MSNSVLTGIRCNAVPHIGNYLGAFKPMADNLKGLPVDKKFFMFIPDLHSFTTPIDHTQLYPNTIYNLQSYIAAGVDPSRENTILYRQSRVPAHSELMWILSCFSYMGELKKMTQFKEKSEKSESVSSGLFIYPVLMAADILLYNIEYIPVGDDQKQHLELARDVAIRMNNRFSEVIGKDLFVVPKPWTEQLANMEVDEGIRIRSLKNPEAKMSKSILDPSGTISLQDDPKAAAKKIMSATTDSIGIINWDWKEQPGITNLLQLAYLLENKSKDEIVKVWQGQTRYGDLKKHVAGLVEGFLVNLQNKIQATNQNEVEKILANGEIKANLIANETLQRVQKGIGLRN